MTTRHASINPYPVWLRLALTSTFLLWAVWAPDAIRLAAGALLAQATRPIFRCPWLGWRREIGFAAFGGLLVALMALPHMDLARLAPFTAMAILRFHLSLTPGLWFSSTLNSRELTYACRRLPPFIALSLELAFRFLPLLGREFCDIYTLQKVRGAWRHGPLSWRIQALLLPFFVRLFRLGDRAAFALAVRGIDPHARRSAVPPDIIHELLAGRTQGEDPCQK